MTDSTMRPALATAVITTARQPPRPPCAIRSVLCLYCRTDKFVYWPPASRLRLADCPGCQRRAQQAEPAHSFRPLRRR
ncbi:MAG: hypothetical protein ABSF03_28040 [Streptosporangiaceae bacterium]|jgi:hypothetical protein